MSKRPFVSQQSQAIKKKKLEESSSGSSSTTTIDAVKTKKIDFDALFADDDEEHKHHKLPPLSSKKEDLTALISTMKTNDKTSREEAEEDSLDAFMSNISKQEEKVVPKVLRDDIEEEDDMETFFKHREKELKKQEEMGSNVAQSQDEDYDSDDLLSNLGKSVSFMTFSLKIM